MTTMVRFDPYRELTGLRDEMGRLLARTYGEGTAAWTPALDVMPKAVKPDEISATFENGVLEVRVPKADEVKPRRIAVEGAG